LITYVDASVVLRVALSEANALAEWERLRPISSELIRVECLRAIERYRWTTQLDPGVLAERRARMLSALKGFDLVAITGPVLERAADPFPVYIGTLDALHLATATIIREEEPNLALATHDAKLGAAARAMGFEVTGV
jgi:uncharacterized protein